MSTFDRNSYNGPSVKDFIARTTILFETAEDLLKKQNLPHDEYDKKHKFLFAEKEATIQELEEKCHIEPIKIDQLKANEEKIIATIREATVVIQKFLFQALIVVGLDTLEDNSTLDKSLSSFADAESQLTAQKGRSNFINYYETPGNKRDEKRVSIQHTVGHTIPSTERFDRGEYEGRLPNFVKCEIGHTEDGELKTEFTGYRHSSYSPIKIRNDFQRQQKAAQIVKDMLVELARQAKNKTEPIELNLSSLTLLTPYHITDSLVPKGEEEYKQLRESYNAVMMYNGRDTVVEVDGQTVKVRLNATMLNAPGNSLGVKLAERKTLGRRLFHAEFEKNMNAQGMSQFIEAACVHLLKEGKQDLLVGMRVIIQKDAGKLINLKNELSVENKNLEKALLIDEKQYLAAKEKVDALNKEIFKIERSRMRQIRSYVREHASEIEKLLEKSKNDELMTLFLQCVVMYTQGRVEPIQYGARFLLANQKMGRTVDFYCKSGEDRTGRMQNMLEELCIFYRNNGYYPRYNLDEKALNSEDQKIQANIALYVNEFSVSRDIANANCIGARGLQITDDLIANAGLPAKTGDAIGKMAKGVYSLRGMGLTDAIKKKVPFLKIDTVRQQMIKDTLAKNRTLLEKQSRLASASERDQEDAHKSVVPERRVIQIDYGIIEQDQHSVRDVSQEPSSGWVPEVDEKIAIEQAFLMVASPFNAKKSRLVLSGTDDEQVGRIHAVLLVLKKEVSALKNLEIKKVNNRPILQLSDKANDIIKAKLAEPQKMIEHQKTIKAAMKADRPPDSNESDILKRSFHK